MIFLRPLWPFWSCPQYHVVFFYAYLFWYWSKVWYDWLIDWYVTQEAIFFSPKVVFQKLIKSQNLPFHGLGKYWKLFNTFGCTMVPDILVFRLSHCNAAIFLVDNFCNCLNSSCASFVKIKLTLDASFCANWHELALGGAEKLFCP